MGIVPSLFSGYQGRGNTDLQGRGRTPTVPGGQGANKSSSGASLVGSSPHTTSGDQLGTVPTGAPRPGLCGVSAAWLY